MTNVTVNITVCIGNVTVFFVVVFFKICSTSAASAMPLCGSKTK